MKDGINVHIDAGFKRVFMKESEGAKAEVIYHAYKTFR